ncbi:RNA polymerase subunit sigma-24 [Cellulomonas sp. Root485]|uniref:sigma-70 family RNA polymerase sigma factor n=1 Tax=Cellulomonas sp. Root485 TaxID=1736546 RepID=UPI0006FD7263|nr:sigma-70 family RNA polymerase sigma factor [Cellulomonas sp. Root485]KQY22735.1 RNA polymerase subunit sigma-24 [Cellulomonas sp. Root485]
MAPAWEGLLDQLVRERYARLVGHAMLLVGSRHDAQDLVQEALIATFTGRARFTSIGQAEQYVRRSIVTRSIDESRRRTRERAALTKLGTRPTTGAVVEERGLGADVVRALQGLAPRERACVVLRQVEDLSVRETAAVLGLSEGAVKRYTSDGTAKLDAALGTTTTHQERADVHLVDSMEARHEH